MPLAGDKIILCILEQEYMEMIRGLRNDPSRRRYFREYRELTEDMQNDWFHKQQFDNTQENFAIKIKGGEIIGLCGLKYINWVYRSAEFAIFIQNNSMNNGYGSDALRTLIKYGFEDLNLNRIWCEVYSNNDALGIYKHIGFTEEGVLRQTKFSEGRYWNSHVLSMLKSEWEELYGRDKKEQ